eukprot:sb/3472614/
MEITSKTLGLPCLSPHRDQLKSLEKQSNDELLELIDRQTKLLNYLKLSDNGEKLKLCIKKAKAIIESRENVSDLDIALSKLNLSIHPVIGERKFSPYEVKSKKALPPKPERLLTILSLAETKDMLRECAVKLNSESVKNATDYREKVAPVEDSDDNESSDENE